MKPSTSFPYGSASSARTRNMVKLLTECEFSVTVIADYNEGLDDAFNCIYLAKTKLPQKDLGAKCVQTLEQLIRQKDIHVIITNAIYYKVCRLI